jgi:hypothetical protein
MSKNKFIVTFHRCYEISEELVIDHLKAHGYTDEEISMVDRLTIAEEIAQDFLVEEMPEFLDNVGDFVSADVEFIEIK